MLQELPRESNPAAAAGGVAPPPQRSMMAISNAIRQKIYTNLTRNIADPSSSSDKKVTASFLENEDVNRSFNSNKGSQLLKVVGKQRAYQVRKFNNHNNASNVSIGAKALSSKFAVDLPNQSAIGLKSLPSSHALVNNFMGGPGSAMSSNEASTQRSGASIRSKKHAETESSPPPPHRSSGKKAPVTTSSILQNANQRALQSGGGGGSAGLPEMYGSAAELALRK